MPDAICTSEFANTLMGASVNGMTLSSMRAFGATFFNFSDYMRPSMRLAALMQIPSIFVFTHDSIGLGEDGPTHQPIEQLASLRAMPNMIVLRPGDANEVVEAWKVIVQLQRVARRPGVDATDYAHARSNEIRGGLRRRQRRLRAG